MICERILTQFRMFPKHCKSQKINPLVIQLLSKPLLSLVTCVRSRTHPKNFEKPNFKKTLIFVHGKKLILQFSFFKKNAYLRVSLTFLYLWNCTKLYEFFIFENCRTSIFVKLGILKGHLTFQLASHLLS